MVKNLPANAGDMRSIPGLGTKTSQYVGQLSLCITTTEDCMPHKLRSMTTEASTMRSLCTATRE